jgi:hypothetical protein
MRRRRRGTGSHSLHEPARPRSTPPPHCQLCAGACLLISAILTNAVYHARQAIGLRLHHAAREVIAEITDDNTQLPQRTMPALARKAGAA